MCLSTGRPGTDDQVGMTTLWHLGSRGSQVQISPARPNRSTLSRVLLTWEIFRGCRRSPFQDATVTIVTLPNGGLIFHCSGARRAISPSPRPARDTCRAGQAKRRWSPHTMPSRKAAGSNTPVSSRGECLRAEDGTTRLDQHQGALANSRRLGPGHQLRWLPRPIAT